jgi:hypothetical protein
MNPTREVAQSDSARAFLDFVKRSAFDPSSVRPWERETLSPYLGLGDKPAVPPKAGSTANPPRSASDTKRPS